MKRRDFVKTIAMSGMAVAASDAVADLIRHLENIAAHEPGDKVVSIIMRSFQEPFRHSLRLSGTPCLQRKPRSAKTTPSS